MEYFIGLVLMLIVFGCCSLVGFDRERSFFPVVMIVIAAYYVLFAAMGASTDVLIQESAAGAVFVLAAVIGFRTQLWLVVAALAGHGVFDIFHHLLIENPGVPHWWPGFCMAADVAIAAYLTVLLRLRPGLGSV